MLKSSISRSTLSRALLGLSLLLPSMALAQDEVIEEDPVGDLQEDRPVQIKVVGFVDDTEGPDCDPIMARYGRCTEFVHFVDDADFNVAVDRDDRAHRARHKNSQTLYAELWRSLSYRWFSDEVFQQQLIEAGATRMPSTSEQWSTTTRDHKKTPIYSVPNTDRWLFESSWIGDQIDGTTPFRTLQYASSVGVLAPAPETILLAGRFATRLAVDGKSHSFDLMDGNQASSGPFFEQMFPYRSALTSDDSSIDHSDEDETAVQTATYQIPLKHFFTDERLVGEMSESEAADLRRTHYKDIVLPLDATIADLTDLASAHFESYYRDIGDQIIRFGREEYTPTHLRVLAALMAQKSPPTAGSSQGRATDVVAASAGQTDSDEMLFGEAGGSLTQHQNFRLDYNELPDTIVNRYLVQFQLWTEADPMFLLDYRDRLVSTLSDLLRPQPTRIHGTDEEALQTWAEENARPGRSLFVSRFLKQIALQYLVEQLPTLDADRIETDILLDHINEAVSASFIPDRSIRQSPTEIEEMTSDHWGKVLSTHGFFTRPIPDGPGAVDPIAICTTKARGEALDEPVFGMIHLDFLVAASSEHTEVNQVIWESRDSLPFVMVDDPIQNRPKVRRMVDLPDGRSIYRIRWDLWSGWHLFWDAQTIDNSTKQQRLALRTAAVCEDTVLTARALVPTLVRAATLDDDFFPTTPVPGNKGKAQLKLRKLSNDEKSARLQTGLNDAVKLNNTVETQQVLFNGSDASKGKAAIAIAAEIGKGISKLQKNSQKIDYISRESVEYLNEVMLQPIRNEASAGPLFLFSFDHSAPRERRKHWFLRPRSPYQLAQARSGDGSYLQTGAWAQLYSPDSPTGQATIVAPGLHPTESVTAKSVIPNWSRPTNNHWAFTAGWGLFPYKESQYACANPGTPSPSTVSFCQPSDTLSNRTDGTSLDIASLRTMWLVDKPAWAVEFGVALQLDTLHPGRSWFQKSNIQYSRAFSPMAGFIGGIRHATAPSPLIVRGLKRYPWGAARPNGSGRIRRSEYGLRGGILVSPSYNGLALTGSAEGWLGYSLQNTKRPTQAYRPRFTVGPYVRAQYSVAPTLKEPPQYYHLSNSKSLHVGIRTQWLLSGGAPELPTSVE